MEGITPEMIALLNSGDKRELRAFLKLYARPVYERALAITNSEADAIRVTRRVAGEVAVLAVRGKLELDIDAQLMAVTDACCSEDLFFARLVDDTISGMPDLHAGTERTGPIRWEADGVRPRFDAVETPREAPAYQAAPPVEPYREAPAYQAAPPVEPYREAPAYQAAPNYQAAQTARVVPSLFSEGPEAELALEDEPDAERKPSVFIVILIFFLSLITLALVWVLVVKLMTIGILPLADFGFAQWFNANIFRLY